MKKLAALLVSLTCLSFAHSARAEIGTADAVPAATLLLPYFEVDLGNPSGITTLMSVNNASASAAVANVVLWTDWGVPSLGFQIYLTGYDVQTFDLRAIFQGQLPVTADDGSDPTDTFDPATGISNQGVLSQDINFPGSTGPCGAPYNLPDPSLALKITNINRVHTGQSSNLDNKCWGASFGDGIARGYVTVDTLTQCTLQTPADAGYFSGVADSRNILWGDVVYVDPGNNFAQGEALVHVESCNGGGYLGYVGNGAGACPFVPGKYTFYSRYVAATALDQREPLATTFAARYQGASKTDLMVWRDTKVAAATGKRTCGLQPTWSPLGLTDVVAFDTAENPTDECTSPGAPCFPFATQRVNLKDGNAYASAVKPPAAGWLYLNLNHTVAGDLFPAVAQAWVSTVRSSAGRFGTGANAIQLDSAFTAPAGGAILIP